MQAACESLEAGLRQLSRQGAWALGVSAGSFGISLKGSFFQGSFMASFEASFLWLHTGLFGGFRAFFEFGALGIFGPQEWVWRVSALRAPGFSFGVLLKARAGGCRVRL